MLPSGDYCENDKRRISTSSQTNYPDSDKIIFARAYINSSEQKKSRNSIEKNNPSTIGPFKLPQTKTKTHRYQKSSQSPHVDTNFSNIITTKNNPTMKIRKINRINHIFKDIQQAKISNSESPKYSSVKKAKNHISIYKKPLSVDIFNNISEELFTIRIDKKPRKKPERNYAMHKTFYDILKEIRQRVTGRE
ncbi:hypothetical protein SteCoe_36512 [Stentor coeruleus]|uniref:Uncharacterized protein n=1 Tax=Stentor coeruleus TaxID=5963 RepID=A0A1R2AQ33_9CILI|nr:hypothetical protein SteCoe_36512 [Stentor coeruleus]